MDILIHSLHYAPEPVGIGLYTGEFAQGLAARGHRVRVVAGKPFFPQWRPYPGQPRGSYRTNESGVEVIRVPHYVPARPSGVKRVLQHLTLAANAMPEMMAEAAQGADLVLTVAPPLTSVPIAARAAKLANAPLWIHVQDFEVEAAFATGLLRAGSLPGRMAEWLESSALAKAQFVSTISPQMIARLHAKGVSPDRTFEMRNWSRSDTDFAAADPAAYRREWRLEDRKVALYSGSIGNKQGLEIVIEAARHLAGRGDIVFVICGEGPNRSRLEASAKSLPNIRFHDLQPSERLGDLLALASVHLLPQIAGAADLVLPSKLTNMLASGRPTIATAGRGTGLFAEVEGCGIATTPGDAAALAEGIAHICDHPEEADRLGQAAARRAAERWQMDAVLDRFEARAAKLVS